jgi:hypothetical protein
MIVPQAFSAGRATRQSAGQWPTSSSPSDIEKHAASKDSLARDALYRSRVIEEIQPRKGTPQADHFKLVLEGQRFPKGE